MKPVLINFISNVYIANTIKNNQFNEVDYLLYCISFPKHNQFC